MFQLSERSIDRLNGVHDDLVEVVNLAIKTTTIDFVVLEGLRTLDRQKELLRAKATRTLNSRHLVGKAVDLGAIVGGKITWHPQAYHKIAEAMLASADKLNIKLTWGGIWESFPDLVHFELDRNFYK